MSSRFIVLVVAVLAACGGGKPLAEPQLRESPATFQRAIGLTLLRTGQARRAVPYLQRLVQLEPRRAEPRCYLGRAFMDMEMWSQAQATLEEAIALEPRHAPAVALLGVLHDARGEHQAAKAAHRRATVLDPDNAAYHNNLGFSLYLDGRYLDAVGAYQTALRFAPGMQRIHNNLGFTYGKLGRLDEARHHFALGGNVAEATNNLGMVHEERGELEQAYAAFESASRTDPELVAARGNLRRICERLGRPMPEIVATPEGRH